MYLLASKTIRVSAKEDLANGFFVALLVRRNDNENASKLSEEERLGGSCVCVATEPGVSGECARTACAIFTV